MTSLLSASALTGRAPTRVALPLRRVAPTAAVRAPRTEAVRVSASSLPHDAKQRGRSHAAVSAKATTGGPPGAGATNPSAAPPVELGSGGGNGSGKGGNGGGGGGGSSGGSSSGGSSDLAKTLTAAGRTLESFPADFSRALTTGVVPASAVLTWLAVETNPIRKLLLFAGGAGFRERLLGDALFLNKLAIECGIGVCTKLSAEAAKRRENFAKEADFVVANVIMAIIADFMLTWLPAPTLPLSPKLASTASAAARFWAGVPDNAFQVVTAGRTFTGVQRLAAVARNGGKLFLVGTAASFIGTGMTNAIIAVRKAMDPSYAQQGEDMDLVKQSLSYGLYMSVSSNLRYQCIAGVVEQRMIEPLLHSLPLASTAASFVVRTGNTFLGSLLWIDFLRLMGLQKQKAAAPAGKKGGKQVEAKKGAKADPKKKTVASSAAPKKTAAGKK